MFGKIYYFGAGQEGDNWGGCVDFILVQNKGEPRLVAQYYLLKTLEMGQGQIAVLKDISPSKVGNKNSTTCQQILMMDTETFFRIRTRP